MKSILLCFLLFISGLSVYGQRIDLKGQIESASGKENIHVINKTAQLYEITNEKGEFQIKAKVNDTIVFSSIQHILKKVIISDLIVSARFIVINLEDQVNTLDEVIVGKVLTGDLLSDIQNVEGKVPINFYDVGIPGYTGKIKTQSERRLSEAGEFRPEMLLGLLGGGLPLNPILNGISGRTKMLKARVRLEEKEALMKSIKARLKKDFLLSNPLEEDLVMDFFYFCSDDENFIKHCKNKTDFEVLIFLRHKYRQYMKNRKDSQD